MAAPEQGCADHVKTLMQVKAFQTICLQKRGALQRVKAAVAKVDWKAPETRLCAARTASAALRQKLEAAIDRAAEAGATSQGEGAAAEAAVQSVEAECLPHSAVPKELCKSNVQRTADIFKAEASRLRLALAERRRFNDCLKLEAG